MKTAVEWLFEQMPIKIKPHYLKQLEQAKELEKQQIIKAVYDSMGTNLDPNFGRAEQYYNETYNNK
jgi:hypothetical protein